MDDIRRPNHQRRDFAMRHRAHRPAAPAPEQPAQPDAQQPPSPAVTPAPYQQPDYQQPAPVHQEAYYDPDSGFAPAAAGADDYSHPAPQARPRPAAKRRRLPKVSFKYAAISAAALVLVGASVYMLTRPAKTSGFSVAQLSKKSTFGFYYPQPLPSGYTYVDKINAFQGGQAYFMLANGTKHLIFHEQAASGGLNLSGLNQPQAASTSVGKAAMGTVAGQPAAKVLAGSTMISINTTGAVPVADLSAVLGHLKTDR